MSGVYIKGFQKPGNCCACPFATDANCMITGYEPTFAEWYENGVSDCPLVPVPPHGDLIDRDELCEGRVSNDNVVICAKCAPTIIPADKEARE